AGDEQGLLNLGELQSGDVLGERAVRPGRSGARDEDGVVRARIQRVPGEIVDPAAATATELPFRRSSEPGEREGCHRVGPVATEAMGSVAPEARGSADDDARGSAGTGAATGSAGGATGADGA